MRAALEKLVALVPPRTTGVGAGWFGSKLYGKGPLVSGCGRYARPGSNMLERLCEAGFAYRERVFSWGRLSYRPTEAGRAAVLTERDKS